MNSRISQISSFRTFALFGLLLTGFLLLPLTGNAHDPSLHTDKEEAPECAALNDMDSKEKDQDDPVVQALLKKCELTMHTGEAAQDVTHEEANRQQ